jgi:hypothetical protein
MGVASNRCSPGFGRRTAYSSASTCVAATTADDAAYRRLLVATQAIMPAQEIRFLVCSDEPIDAAAFAGLDVARGTGHLLEDMYALAGCDYLIGPPSTYTAWASFYGRVPLFVARQSEVQPQPEDFSVVSG